MRTPILFVSITPNVLVPQTLDLPSLHTRYLLKLLKESYMDYGYSYLENSVTKEQNRKLKMWQIKLKKELATREHIPNKKESRELRIQRKRSGISRKKKKR